MAYANIHFLCGNNCICAEKRQPPCIRKPPLIRNIYHHYSFLQQEVMRLMHYLGCGNCTVLVGCAHNVHAFLQVIHTTAINGVNLG